MTSPDRQKLLWLQSGGCGGCSISMLGAQSPDLITALASAGIEVLWHPSLSQESGADLLELLQGIIAGETRLDILCVEGAVMRGPGGTGLFHVLAGTGRPMMAWIEALAMRARHVVAVGSCAAFGGISSGGGNHTEACGVQYEGAEPGGLLGEVFRSASGLPVVNIAGCPTHPNWVVETLAQLAMGEMDTDGLDPLNRPRSYTDHLVHHGCPRNEFYEYKASAEHVSELGCMMEHLGCMGTQAHADCNTRLWNGEGSCLRGGFACIACTHPGFEEPGYVFGLTRKIAGIPVGLPTDMPKAWFVALASLAKAATPPRLKENAVADHIVVPPKTREKP
ncbi:MAG: hypothetical protein WDA11_08415 [Thiohalomonadaceae bacterium]